MTSFGRIFGDHRIDDWASDHTLIAARTLNQVAADVIRQAEDEIAGAGWVDGLVAQSAFVNARIAPLVRQVAEPVARQIVENANAALRDLAGARAVWVRSPEHVGEPARALDGAQDIAVAAVPLAAGAATAAALPFAAVTTTTAWFGLATVTAINWPVVVVGGAVAATGVATGLVNAARIWDKTEARLRERVRRFVLVALLEGDEKCPSILRQVETELTRVAMLVKRA